MGRPPSEIHRDHQLTLKLTAQEYLSVVERAQVAGLRPAVFVRRLVTERELFAAATRRVDPRLYQHWARVGSNLNQVARQLNTMQRVEADDVLAVLAELRALMAEPSS